MLNGYVDGSHGGLRRLALAERHAAAGARFAPFAGWDMPLQYAGIVAEHEAVRGDVGVFDVSHLGRAWVRGAAAGSGIRAATTYDVRRIAPGNSHYSLYCNAGGGIEDDIFVYRVTDDRWLVAHNAANAEADFSRLSASVALAGAQAEEWTGASVMLAVQGPHAPALLARLLGPVCAEIAPRACVEFEWQGATVLFARTGYTGEDGGECIVAAEHASTLWDALLAAGAQPIGLGARDTLRLEAALPLHGHDIDATTEPYSAGLGFAVTLDDGASFTGRAALAQFASEPPGVRLICLRATERGVVFRTGAVVHAEAAGSDEALGHLASGAFSPTLRVSIGMAYLPAEFAVVGTHVAVDIRGQRVPAEVVRRPFVRGSARRA
jgi:aminomethyltransferase